MIKELHVHSVILLGLLILNILGAAADTVGTDAAQWATVTGLSASAILRATVAADSIIGALRTALSAKEDNESGGGAS